MNDTANSTATVPVIGSYWEGQGGIRAAAEIPTGDGRFYDLVVVCGSDRQPIVRENLNYGFYGIDVPGASNYTDGLANHKALIAADSVTGSSPLARAAVGVVSADGHTDCYPPAMGEQNIVRAVCPDLLPKVWMLSSTQLDRITAWCQFFSYGYHYWYYKDSKHSVFFVRRVIR